MLRLITLSRKTAISNNDIMIAKDSLVGTDLMLLIS